MTPADASARPPLPQLFAGFVKIGAVLIGGGYALLPLLEDEFVRRRKWVAESEMADYFAVAQILPGVIAMNASMLVGLRLRGVPGLLAASAGLLVVPFFLILAYAALYTGASRIECVENALAGARPAVAGMILALGARMLWRSLPRGRKNGAGRGRA